MVGFSIVMLVLDSLHFFGGEIKEAMQVYGQFQGEGVSP